MSSLTTKQVIIRITIIVSLAEFLVMLMLVNASYDLSPFAIALLDASLLVVLSAPLIYTWVIKPFVIAHDKAVVQITHLAFNDALTQLPNRRLLFDLLEKFIAACSRHRNYCAVLLLDLNEFKPINDQYGHDAGDAVLVEVARRLKLLTRTEDVVSRIGGDEFVILIGHLGDEKLTAQNRILEISQKLHDAINDPIEFKDEIMHVSASIGIFLSGLEKIGKETALKKADIAMYRAKKKGGGVQFYSGNDK